MRSGRNLITIRTFVKWSITARNLNRILFDREECIIEPYTEGDISAHLDEEDYRCKHIKQV